MIYIIAAAVMLIPVYLLWVMVDALQYRIEKLEKQKHEPSGKTGQSEFYPPVENFNPEKPETLRPKMVRGREVLENVYEFDAKI